MKCSRCRKRLDGPNPVDHEYLQRWGITLCYPCLSAWEQAGRKQPEYLSHRWKILLCFVALLYLAGIATVCLAEPVVTDEPQLLLSKTCYNTSGAISYPFHCERYGYKGSVYWVGFLLDGTIFRIEEETPLGTVVRYNIPFIDERNV